MSITKVVKNQNKTTEKVKQAKFQKSLQIQSILTFLVKFTLICIYTKHHWERSDLWCWGVHEGQRPSAQNNET